MKNSEYKYEKYYKKFINTNNIIKKIKYISKILFYKKNLINQVGGGLLENRELEINKIFDIIPLIISKVELIKRIYDLVLEHDNLTEFFDSNFSYYKNNDDLIEYYNNIIININNK